ncbi:MAG: glycosyltransferase family 39 protein [Deltaproteobacteria bacterium]|nr:glycosyltransferase family 39 protein [Deltaproteobacteria bacterium]
MNFFSKHPPASLLVVGVFCYLAFFHALGNYALWDPDEGRSGVIAKEMLDSGEWSSLTLHGEPYYDKPAPYFWLLAVGLKTLGFNEFSLRLPSAIAASLTVFLVYLLAAAFWGWKRGLWAGLVLVGSVEFVVLGRFAKMDMVFNFFFTAALLFFWWWKEQTKGKAWIWPFYLFLAVAALAKGPVGLLLALLIVVITLSLEKRWELLRELRLLSGMVIFLLVSGSWYLWAAVQHPEYIWTFLWDHNVVRFFTTEGGIKHSEPVYFLVLVLIGGFLPWSLFLPAVLHSFWGRRSEEGKAERLFLIVWVATILIFFSLSRNKLGTYVLPAFPPLALLTGEVLERAVRGEEIGWRWSWVLYSSLGWFLLLFSLPALSEWVLKPHFPQHFSSPPALLPAAVFLVLGAIGWALGKKRWLPCLVAFSALWLVLWFYGSRAPELFEIEGVRNLAKVVNGIEGKEYRLYAIRAESFSFYVTGHRVEVAPHPDFVVKRLVEPIPTVVLVKEKHLAEIHAPSPEKFFVWKSFPSGHALVANFPPPPAQDLGRAPKR